ncbi:hypothetical protein HDU85_001791, partial [Gaertneriomyces sp. JEL0708]
IILSAVPNTYTYGGFYDISIQVKEPKVVSLQVGGAEGLNINSTVTAAPPTIGEHLTTKGYVDGISYLTAGTGLLKSGNILSVNPALVVNTLTTTSGISVAGHISATGNIGISDTFSGTLNTNSGFIHILNNQSTGSSAFTSVQLRCGGSQGLNLSLNSSTRTLYGGLSSGTLQNYVGDLRLISKSGKGIIVDEHGAVDVSERLSVGTTSDVVAFPPANLMADSTTLSGQAYGNGNYVVSSSSKFNNSTQHDAWHAFTDSNGLYPWYPLTGTYKPTAPFDYVGSISTTINGAVVSGEWIQLTLPLSILLTSFDIAVMSTTSDYYIKEFVLVASNDGTAFTQLMTSTLPWGPPAAQSLNVPVQSVSKAFKTYRLIIKSLNGSRTYGQVSRLIFNGRPVSMDFKGALSTKQVITENLVCSGDMNINGLDTIEENVGNVMYPDVQMTAATTESYTATASTTLSASWTPWKLYNGYAGNDSNTWFSSAGGRYSYASPSVYTGSVSTTVDGAAVL